MPARSYCAPDDEAGDVLQEHQRNAAQVAQLDEVRGLQRRLGEQHAVVGDDADQEAVEPGEAGDQRAAVALLELVEARAVDHPRDDLADLVRLARVGVHDAVDLARVVERVLRRGHVGRRVLCACCSVADDRPGEVQRVVVVFGEVVGDAREPRVDVGAAELLGRHFFAGRRLHERRAAEEDRAGALDDDRFVGHRRHVGAAGRARAHDDGDLRDPLRRHPRLVEEDAAEVIAIGEDLRLERQERAAGVDQVDARQAVLRARPPARARASSP